MHPAHLISIPPATARLLLIGWELTCGVAIIGFFFFLYLTVWTANEKERRAETALFNKRKEQNMRRKITSGKTKKKVVDYEALQSSKKRITVLLHWEKEKSKGFCFKGLGKYSKAECVKKK